MRLLTNEEKCGAEQFYQKLQCGLSNMKPTDEFLKDIIIATRKYIRDKFIEFLKEGK